MQTYQLKGKDLTQDYDTVYYGYSYLIKSFIDQIYTKYH